MLTTTMNRISIIVGVVVLQIASTHALRGSSRNEPNQHRQLDRLDDLSESLDETIGADYYEAETGVNPDSGDEDYTIHEWDIDPLDDTLEVDAVDEPILGNTTNTNIRAGNATNATITTPGNTTNTTTSTSGNVTDSTTTSTTNATSTCVECTNIPTPYMLDNNFHCNDYSFAYVERCGTNNSWWGRDGNVEHCQYSCWVNDVPFASMGNASCCDRDDADDTIAPIEAIRHNGTDPLLEEPGNGLGEGMLNICQGDCDYDIDCAGDLVCWYEDGSGAVPGCSGTPRQYWEYCIDPSVIPPKNVTHSDKLVDFGNGLGPAALGRCQGDCDYDIDCADGNVCFYSDGTGIVPGCEGAPTRSWEYCADPDEVKEHLASIGRENLNSTDGYCPADLPYDGREELGSVDGTVAKEVSGMVNGRRNPNILYVHNDRNNDPMLMAIDKSNGRMVGNWALGGITHIDYEDISNGPGPNPDLNYLHLCDIGDNPKNRNTVWIHRLPEPALTGGLGAKTFYPQTLTLHYPDGPKNAESCLVDPLTGLIYIIQKTSGTSKIYRTETPWGDGDETMKLKMVGTVNGTYKESRWGNVFTGVDISPNGRDIVLLSYGGLDYRCRDANESIEDALGRFGLHLPAYKEEPNGGESIAFSSDMTGLYSCQESGGWSKVPLYHYPATFAGLLEGRSSAALNTRASVEESNAPTTPPTTTPSSSPSIPPSPSPSVPPSQEPSAAPTTEDHGKAMEKIAENREKMEEKANKLLAKGGAENKAKANEILEEAEAEYQEKADEIALRTQERAANDLAKALKEQLKAEKNKGQKSGGSSF